MPWIVIKCLIQRERQIRSNHTVRISGRRNTGHTTIRRDPSTVVKYRNTTPYVGSFWTQEHRSVSLCPILRTLYGTVTSWVNVFGWYPPLIIYAGVKVAESDFMLSRWKNSFKFIWLDQFCAYFSVVFPSIAHWWFKEIFIKKKTIHYCQILWQNDVWSLL